MITVFNRN